MKKLTALILAAAIAPVFALSTAALAADRDDDMDSGEERAGEQRDDELHGEEERDDDRDNDLYDDEDDNDL